MTIHISYQTDLIARRIGFSKEVQAVLKNNYGGNTIGYKEQLVSDFEGKSDELQGLIDAAGMADNNEFTKKASELFIRLYKLLRSIVKGDGKIEDIDAVENNFINIFDGLFELDTQLNEINPELQGELTNRGFVCSAISIVWDFMTYYDNNRVSKQTMAPGVTRLEDIPYIDDGTNEHMLDVYYPDNTTEKLPLIIDIHGGGLMMGDKDSNKIYCSVLASFGYTVVSINYRLSPDVLYPSQIQDIMSAYKWVSENSDKYFYDLDKLYVTGDSAGGQLAYYTAIVNTSEQLQQLYSVEPTGISIDALGLVSGMYDMKYGPNGVLISCFFGFNYNESQYYNYLQPEEILDLGVMPPSYIVSSTKDFLHSSAVMLDDVLTQKGIEHQFRDWPISLNRSSGHITSVAYPELDESKETINEMLAYFQEHTK